MRNNVMVIVAAAALASGANALDASAQGKLKIGFVYLGPVGDFGWTYQHEVGRRALLDMEEGETAERSDVSPGGDVEDEEGEEQRQRRRLLDYLKAKDSKRYDTLIERLGLRR